MLYLRLWWTPGRDYENLSCSRLDDIEKDECSRISRAVHGFNLIFVLISFSSLCYFIEAVS